VGYKRRERTCIYCDAGATTLEHVILKGFKTTVHLENETFLRVNRSFGTLQALTEKAGLDPRTIQRIRAGTSLPRQHHRTVLMLVAADLIGNLLAPFEFDVPDDPVARLALYVDSRQLLTQRRCACCGDVIVNGRARYCSPRCKKRAYRARLRKRA
jgi:hypothetical protein